MLNVVLLQLRRCNFIGNLLRKQHSSIATTSVFSTYGRLCHNYATTVEILDNHTTSPQPGKGGKMKVLNVAEKNDSAKHIAEMMTRGRSTRREGLSKFNKIYEFQYQVQGVPANMVMTSVSGHLLGLDFSQTYKKWNSCHPTQLFDLPVNKECKEANMINIKKTLEKEVRGAQMLIIWTDCDREGENIGMEIVDVCRAVNRNIKVLRARFSEITRPSIERAMQTLTQISHTVSDAVDCRMELDLRIGAAFTRFQTLRLQKMFPESLGDKLISYGSCQFPTMGFVVERYKEIENFVAESFWKLKVIHQIEDIRVEFAWQRNRLFDEDIVKLYHEICQENPVATVQNCHSKPKSKWRPLPLDTVELQKLGNRKLRMSAKSIMATAEKLYTQGFISYPRTETNIFPKELDLNPMVQAQTNDNRWGEFAGKILTEFGGPKPRQGKKTDEAHPPIHPTKYSNSLQGDEGRLYEFIVRHFLACVSRDAQGKETTVHIDINGEKFVGHGLTVIQRNYLEVYPYEKWSDKEILDYEVITEFEPTSIDMLSGQTEPPKLLTEADLIALMDKNGIGTDATQAEHIETIKNREYVFVEDRDKLVPGKLGMALVEGYDSMNISMSKPHLRAGLENDLKLICDGVKTKEEVLQSQIEKYRQIFVTSMENAINLDAATGRLLGQAPALTINPNENAGSADIFSQDIIPGLDLPEPVVQCSSCNSTIVLKKRANGSWMITCQGYPACRQTLWLPAFITHAKVTEDKCQSCPGSPNMVKIKMKPRSLSPFYPDELTVCFGGCDQELLNMLSIDKLNNGRVAAPPVGNSNDRARGRGTGNTTTARGRGARGARGGATHFDGGPPPRGGGNDPDDGWGGDNGGRGQGRGSTTSRGGGNRGRGSQQFQGGRSQDSGYNTTNYSQSSQEEGSFTCNCGAPAIIRTVRKEGQNQGREFAKCETGMCGFFQWTDDSPPTMGQTFMTDQDSGDVIINCDCGIPSTRRTVQKDGPNKGRDFYCCSKPRETQCKYFFWADGNEPVGGGQSGGMGNNYQQPGWGGGGGYQPQGGGYQEESGDDGGAPMCQCQYQSAPAILRTVQKDGPNKGRQFYVCSKPRDSQCSMFAWADEPTTSRIDYGTGRGKNRGARGSSRGGGGGRGRGNVDAMLADGMYTFDSGRGGGRGAQGGGGVKKPRTCGLCRQPGHTRNKCPLNT